MDWLILRCPQCSRIMAVEQTEHDPPTATLMEVRCAPCNAGDFDSESYFDVHGRDVTRDRVRRRGPQMTPPDSGEREVPQHHVPPPTQVVSLPLSLAQRILAALERDIWTELAAELRERMPR